MSPANLIRSCGQGIPLATICILLHIPSSGGWSRLRKRSIPSVFTHLSIVISENLQISNIWETDCIKEACYSRNPSRFQTTVKDSYKFKRTSEMHYDGLYYSHTVLSRSKETIRNLRLHHMMFLKEKYI